MPDPSRTSPLDAQAGETSDSRQVRNPQGDDAYDPDAERDYWVWMGSSQRVFHVVPHGHVRDSCGKYECRRRVADEMGARPCRNGCFDENGNLTHDALRSVRR